MTFEEYHHYFETIVTRSAADQVAPYDNPIYLEYTKLNWTRYNRWQKSGVLSEASIELVKAIRTPQTWTVILEPWCGDAAHSVPFIALLAKENPNVSLVLELRDSEPFRINEYLTNGSKSIPKLIISDNQGDTLATWGPRPRYAQDIYQDLIEKKVPFEEVNVRMQTWYNTNKGQDVQEELSAILELIMHESKSNCGDGGR